MCVCMYVREIERGRESVCVLLYVKKYDLHVADESSVEMVTTTSDDKVPVNTAHTDTCPSLSVAA